MKKINELKEVTTGADYPSSGSDYEVSAGYGILRNAHQLARVHRRTSVTIALKNVSCEERLKLRKDKDKINC